MASILKVSQLQKPDGSTPTAADLGIDVAGSVVQHQYVKPLDSGNQSSNAMWTTATFNTWLDYVSAGNGNSITFNAKDINNVVKLELSGSVYGRGNSNWVGLHRNRIVTSDGTTNVYTWPAWTTGVVSCTENHHTFKLEMYLPASEVDGLTFKPQIFVHSANVTDFRLYEDHLMTITEIAQ